MSEDVHDMQELRITIPMRQLALQRSSQILA